MCGIADIFYVQREGPTTTYYEVDADGRPLYAVVAREQANAGRNVERRIWQLIDDITSAPWLCNYCGQQFRSWQDVAQHCDMYLCRTCGGATYNGEGWDNQCRTCDSRSRV
jgi:hypothetical protein